MKALIIYAAIWIPALTLAGIVYLSGYFNEMAMTIFGFVFSTIFFAGFGAALPYWMDERHSWKYDRHNLKQ